jgi:eukaryotic-like serine/threonine-protein kinase
MNQSERITEAPVTGAPQESLRYTLGAATEALLDGETLPPFTRLGPYQIDALLGRGGMGVVYRVLQLEPIRRLVALKLVRGENTPIAQAFFEIERQALAQMNHPTIAKVFDAGVLPNGELFFAMEWVDGLPLDAYLRQNQMPLANLLRLFINIAYGVHHAHVKSLIHRDLKPGNVLVHLVDGRAQPKIIDFGVAVGADAKGAAKVRDQAGTLAYMAPEQLNLTAEGIDRRADVFALGAMFAESLCLALRLEVGRANATHLRAILAKTDSRLSQRFSDGQAVLETQRKAIEHAKRIPRELRAIALTAMAFARDARYDSAQAFAQDIENYLSKRVVNAMRGGRFYAVKKFAARHRVAFFSGIALTLALIAGLATALYGLRAAELARARAEIEAQSAQQTADFLGNVLSGVDPDLAKSSDRTLLRAMLDQAAQKAQSELRARPEILRRIETVVAKSYFKISEYPLAVKHVDVALATFSNAPDTLNEAQFSEQSELQISRIDALSAAGKVEDALKAARDLSARSTQRLGADHDISLRAQSAVIWQMFLRGDLKPALALAQAHQSNLERVLGPQNAASTYNLQTLAILQGELGLFADSDRNFNQLVQRFSQIYGQVHSKTVGMRQGLAVNYLRQNRFADAEKILKDMLPEVEQNFGKEHAATINVYANLAGALRQGGKLAESAFYYQTAYTRSLAKNGPEHESTLQLGINLANYEIANKQAAAALARLDQIDPVLAAKHQPSNPFVIEALRTRARAYGELGNIAQARSSWRKVLELDRQAFGSEQHPQYLDDQKALLGLAQHGLETQGPEPQGPETEGPETAQ